MEDFPVLFRVTETQKWLDKLLPVPKDVIEGVFAIMKQNGTYSESESKWKHFPLGEKFKEDEIYPAFIQTANAIRTATEELAQKRNAILDERLHLGSNEWFDNHTKSPTSQDPDGALLRPDVVLRLNNGSTSTSWSQFVAVVEIKRKDGNIWDVAKQLTTYLRRILCEQFDRRFVFGFAVGPETLHVLLHDRSGILAGDELINFHMEPRLLVQIIAAFVMCPATSLGFASDMLLYDEDEKSATATYRLQKALKPIPNRNRRWVITMNDGRQYLTVKTLSYAAAANMRGRGTIAWSVIPYERRDQALENEELLVLKQSWIPVHTKSELEFYNEAQGLNCDQIGKIEACEKADIAGMEDTTGQLIRRGLTGSPPSQVSRGEKRPRDENDDTAAHQRVTEPFERHSGTVSRVRTRTLLATYGWPLKRFSTLRELIQVMRDAIRGHQHLYMHGVLHRDISTGNIIIVKRQVPTTTNDSAATGDLTTYPPYGGCLIDLDRAACGEKSGKEIDKEILGTDLPPEADNSASESDQLQDINFMKRTLHKTFPSMTIQIDVAEAALLAYSNIHMASLYLLKAIQHYITFHHETVISAGNLLWELTPPKYNYEDLRISVTLTSDSEVHSRTGTPPYISYEILAGMAYFQERNIMHHDAIHDIESFFWVLVYLCLTRGGPGGTRRKEFDEAAMQTDLHAFIERQPEATRFLIQVVSKTFDSLDQNDLQKAKLGFFRNPAMFDNVVVANFHAYFEPLKGLIREWFSLLRLAYEFPNGYEYLAIHNNTLDILDRALNNNALQLDDLLPAGQHELTLRDPKNHPTTRDPTTPTMQASAVSWDPSPKAVYDSSNQNHNTKPPPSPSQPPLKKVRNESR